LVELSGYTREELLQIFCIELIHPLDRDLVANNVMPRLAGKKAPGDYEFRAVNRAGEVINLRGAFSLLELNGRPAILAQVVNITEQKQVQEALLKSEQNYRSILNRIEDGYFEVDLAGNFTCYNDSLCKALGYSREQLAGMNYRVYTPQQNIDVLYQTYNRVYKTGRPTRMFDWQIVRRDGEARIVEASISLIRDEEEAPKGFRGIVRDITERKQIEEKLQKINEELETANEELVATNEELIAAEEELRQQLEELERSKEALAQVNQRLLDIIEFLPDATFVIDQHKKVIAWNRAIEEMTGVSKKEIVGKGDYAYAVAFYDRPRPILIDMIGLDDQDVSRYYENVTRRGSTVYTEVYSSYVYGGKGAFLRAAASPLYDNKGNVVGAIESIRDISEYKLQKAYFQQLFENSPSGIAIMDNQDRIMFVNKSFELLFQYSAEEIKGCSANDTIVPESLVNESIDLLNRIVGGEIIQRETVRKRKDGSRVWVALLGYPIIIGNKQVGISAIYSDITERKMAMEALRESEDRYRTIFETAKTATVIIEEDTTISLANREFVNLSGYTKKEIEGIKSWTGFVFKDDLEKMKDYHYRRRKDPNSVPREYEFGFVDRQGNLKHVLLSAAMIPGTKKSVVSLLDFTERKKTEEQLKYLSLKDNLTGLYNRAFFEREMARLEGSRYAFRGIIVCDVDGLKLANDTLGHHVGDALLVAASRVIMKSFREDDVVARIGGDEFAVLLPNSDPNTVECACQRIRVAVDKYNQENPQLPLSVSLGFATSEDGRISINDLYKEADNNMYREKLHRSKSARSAIVQTLMKALEARDFITEGHADRLSRLIEGVAVKIGLPERNVADLRLLAQFHDIGKVGIPDRILFKKGTLTYEEFAEMRRHSEIGHRIALSAPDLAPIADWILKHHEWYDGTGYPLGLKGAEIPLECRILAIADAYDAMTNDRPYRRALDHEEALAELKKCAGTQFDPALVDKFVQVLESQVS
jgi:diguanylate cyclase (GGDEF)-like protein/PAS domain S-box-containing protein